MPTIFGIFLRFCFITPSIYILWAVVRGLYNVYFHPLTRYGFKGPRMAAATTWWRAHLEIVRKQSILDVLPELHHKYGDVVRIGPNELHFSRPSVHAELYGQRWSKDGRVYHIMGEEESSFGFEHYQEAKERRDVLGPLFSRQGIMKMRGLIDRNLELLCAKLSTFSVRNKSADFHMAYRCFTIDSVTTYCFAKSTRALEAPDFNAPLVNHFDGNLPLVPIVKNFPLVAKINRNLPRWLAKLISGKASAMANMQAELWKEIHRVTKDPKSLAAAPHPTIYQRLLDPAAHKGRPPPAPHSLFDEAVNVVAGGTGTAATALTLGTFHVLQNPVIKKKLKAELSAAWPLLDDVPRYEVLESLPYLTAVIKESLRISPNVPIPLPRIVPMDGATLSERFIPGGTVVAMSNQFVHQSSEIFPDPKSSQVERWLEGPASKAREAFLAPFSKGPRMCLGINMAYYELYVTFAHIFRRFDLQLDGTTIDDLRWKEFFLSYFPGRHLHAFLMPVDD